jgi:hypothetical protein
LKSAVIPWVRNEGGPETKKAQIVEKVLKDFWTQSEENGISRGDDDAYYEKTIVEAVQKSLQQLDSDADIRTCEDFGYLNVKCCDCCHGIYQHFEVSLIEIESGGSAWICCALDRALNPAKHANDPKLPENCKFDEMLAEFIRWSEDAK